MFRKPLLLALSVAGLAAAAPTHAGSLSQVDRLIQSDFLKLSKDLGAALAYKGVTPATPLGIVGVDVGLELTSTQLEHSSVFAQAGAGPTSRLLTPKLHISKGLPGGFDIGAVISKASDLDASLVGAELRYALIADSLASPAVGLRLAGTKASGLGQVDFSTLSLDFMVSKKLTLVTPFAGAGVVRAKSQPRVAGLREERFNESRVFLGVNANFAVVNFAVEAEKQGGATSLSAKAGWRF